MKIRIVYTLMLVVLCTLFVRPNSARSGTHYGNASAKDVPVKEAAGATAEEQGEFLPLTRVIPGYNLFFN